MKIYKQTVHNVKEAYQAIHDFFSCYHLHEALEEVDRLFKWACKKKYYNKSAPADIIFCSQQLYRLFSAAEIINYSAGKRMSTILYDTTAAQPLPAHYMKEDPRRTQWECQPRHLTAEEYLNPYWALRKLTSVSNWEEVLEELTEAALSNGSIEGNYTIAEVMKWRKRMMAVVEGGWLVEARGNLITKYPTVESSRSESRGVVS